MNHEREGVSHGYGRCHARGPELMDRSKQAAAVVVIAIGLIVVSIGAVVLLSELKKERETREKLEEEVSALQLHVEELKVRKVIDLGSWIVD